MERPEITVSDLNMAITVLQKHMAEVLNHKGPGAFISSHEIVGVLMDERSELIAAIQSKSGLDAIRHELLDEATAAIFGVACIDARTLDW